MSKRGVNKVILLGRIGQDPEVRYTPSGDAVANFSLATSEVWSDKQSGQKMDRTEWHRCVAWRKIAEIIQQYAHKGDMLFLEGHLQTKKWQDQQGQDRYQTEIVVDEIQLLGGNKQEGAQPNNRPAQASRPAQSKTQEPPPDFDGFDDINF